MEKTVYRVWKNWKLGEFHFAKYVTTLVLCLLIVCVS